MSWFGDKDIIWGEGEGGKGSKTRRGKRYERLYEENEKHTCLVMKQECKRE